MDDSLLNYWNQSQLRVPKDKNNSTYVQGIEKFFKPGGLICDLGGGIGTESIYLLSKGHNVVLIEISDLGIKTFNERAEFLGYSGHFKTVQKDYSDGIIPLENGSVDGVYSRLSLHYFSKEITIKLLREIFRILKPGGKAFITLKSPADEQEMEFLKRSAREIEPGVFLDEKITKSRYTLDQLRIMIDEAGIYGSVSEITEELGVQKEVVKSGNEKFILNEVVLKKN